MLLNPTFGLSFPPHKRPSPPEEVPSPQITITKPPFREWDSVAGALEGCPRDRRSTTPLDRGFGTTSQPETSNSKRRAEVWVRGRPKKAAEPEAMRGAALERLLSLVPSKTRLSGHLWRLTDTQGTAATAKITGTWWTAAALTPQEGTKQKQ